MIKSYGEIVEKYPLSTKEEAIKLFKDAIEETLIRNNGIYWQPLDSTKHQLEYLLAVLEGHADKNRLLDIMYGFYIVHEFEDMDMDYANLLYRTREACKLIEKDFWD